MELLLFVYISMIAMNLMIVITSYTLHKHIYTESRLLIENKNEIHFYSESVDNRWTETNRVLDDKYKYFL